MSLKAALETLGFGPCYHMIEVFEHPEHAGFWQAAWRGEPVDWDGLLGGYEAAVDWPACTFYEELLQRHPDARVLLSVRDPERWYESTRDTIYQINLVQDHRRLSTLPRGLRVRRPLRPRGLRDQPDGQRDHLAGHLRWPLRGTLRRDSGLCATQRGGQKGCKSPRAPSRAGTATRTPPRTPTQCTEVARQRIEDLPRFPSVRAASP